MQPQTTIPTSQSTTEATQTIKHKIHYSEEEENVIDNFISKSRPSMKVKEMERSHSSAAQLSSDIVMFLSVLVVTFISNN